MTPYQQFVRNWSTCTACPLHATRSRVVLARGSVPAQVLFVGEAPGRSEDVVGLPFVGPAGRLMDHIIARSVPPGVAHALCNLVCCIPLGEDGQKTAEPDDEAVRACAPRLREFVGLCRPSLIVCVGALARDWLDRQNHHNVWREDYGRLGRDRKLHFGADVPRIDVTHPAAILRQPVAQQGLSVQRCVVKIGNAVEEYVTHAAQR